ncbi:MAG: TraE/TraK family type IV conjugative transfer system protein [Pseudomonadota bacterium]
MSSDSEQRTSDRAQGLFKRLTTARGGEPRRVFDHYLNEAQNLAAENGLLKLVSIASFATALLMSIVVGVQAQNTRVIVAPFGGASADLLIVGDQPSTEYLSAISRNIISLTGTFNASNADAQFNEVLKFVHPSAYNAIREEWKEMVEGLRKYREVSFATYIMPQKPIEIYGDRLRVWTTRIRYVGERITEEVGVVEIAYVVEDGRFWVLNVEFMASGGGNGKS